MAVENPFGGDQEVELRVRITSDNPTAIISAIGELNGQLGGALEKTEKWAVGTRGATSTATRGLQDTEKQVKNTSTAVKDMADGTLPRLRYALYDVASTMLAVNVATAGLQTTFVAVAAKQESAFANVQRTADGGAASVQQLRGELQKMSTEIPVSFNNLSAIATLGNQLGVATDQLGAFTNTVAKFSAVSGVSTDQAAQMFGSLGSIMHFSADQYSNFASAVELVGRKSAATDSQILSLTKEISQQAYSAGFGADQVVALAGALGQLQVAPERARGSLTEYFQKLNQAVASGGKDLQNFAVVTGLTADQLSKMVANGQGVDVFQRFLQGLSSGGNVIATTKALDALGLSQLRVSDTFQRLTANQQVFTQYLGLSSSAYQQNTELNRQFAIIMDTLSAKWTIFLNALQNFAAAMGTAVMPALKQFLTVSTDVLNALTGFIQSPIGQFFANQAQLILTAVAAYTGLRAAIAFSTAGLLAFRTAAGLETGLLGSVKTLGTQFLALGGYSRQAAADTAVLGAEAKTTDAALRGEAGSANAAAAGAENVGKGARVASTGIEILRAAFIALGKAFAVLTVVNVVINLMQDARTTVRDFFKTIVDNVAPVAKGILTIVGAIAQVIGAFTHAKDVQKWGDTMVKASGDTKFFNDVLKQIKSGIDDATKWLPTATKATDGFSNAADIAAPATDAFNVNLGDLSNNAKKAAVEVHTLADYADDLSSVMKRAFDIRFGPEQGLDAIASGWNAIADRTAQATQQIADYQAQLAGLNADKNTQQYQLGVANLYGDNLRADAIRSQLTKTNTDIASTQTNLTKAQQDASLALSGNTTAAIQNRAALLGLVTSYEDYIQKLAASGASQSELNAQTAALKQQFIAQATQMGFSSAEVQKYAAAFDDMGTIIRNVPRNVTVGANTNPALQALNEFLAKAAAARANAKIGATIDPGAWANQGNQAGAAFTQGISDELRKAASRFATAFPNVGPLKSGYVFANSLGNTLGSLFAGGGGGGGGGGGFAEGGYTGGGGKFDPAGIVHRGEYVFSAEATRNLGIGNLALMHAIGKSGRGFASGSSTAGAAFGRWDPRDIDQLARAIAYYGPDLRIDASAIGAATSAYNRANNGMGRN